MDNCVIGIDIDGTINEAHKYDIIHGREFCREYGINPMESLNNCSVKDMFNLSDSMYITYLDKYFKWNVCHNEVRPGAAETIREWVRQGHIIKIITARDPEYKGRYSGKEMVEDTIKWFRKNQIPYHDMVFGCKDKAKACVENDVDTLIDDDPMHIISVSEVPRKLAIIAGQSYNEYLIGYKSTVWCADWLEIRGVVHELCTMY